MGQRIDPIVYRGFHRGMADRTVLADSLMPTNQMRLVQNMDTDAIGFLTGRNGYTRVGSAVLYADEGQGLLQHDGTNPVLVAFVYGESYYLSGSSWLSKGLSYDGDAKIRSVSFLDRVMVSNGLQSPKSWDGSVGGAWDGTNFNGAPTGALLGSYKQQLFIGNTTTDRVTFSSLPDSSGVSITWPSGNYFILNPNDGTNLTAMNRFGKEFLFSKVGLSGSFMYRFNGRSADADPVIYFGAASQEATFVSGSIFWFYDPVKSAIVAYQGGFPQVVSKPVRSFLKAIPTNNRDLVCLWGDEDHVEAFIGDVTVDGIAFANVSLRYVISTQTWVIRTYAHEFRVFADYDDGSNFFHLGFTSEGSVVKMDTGNDDLGSNIIYDLQTAWITIGGNPALEQTLASLSAFMDNGRAMSVFLKTDVDPSWRPIGQVRQVVSSWAGINAPFHRIKLRFTGTSNGDPAIFDGFSLTNALVEGINEKENE